MEGDSVRRVNIELLEVLIQQFLCSSLPFHNRCGRLTANWIWRSFWFRDLRELDKWTRTLVRRQWSVFLFVFVCVQQCYDTWNISDRNRSKRTKEAKRLRYFFPSAPRLFSTWWNGDECSTWKTHVSASRKIPFVSIGNQDLLRVLESTALKILKDKGKATGDWAMEVN